MGDEIKPYVCKHGCERDKLKDLIFAQAREAAKAARHHAARIAQLEAELAGAREALRQIALDEGGLFAGNPARWPCYRAVEALAGKKVSQDEFRAFRAALKDQPHDV